MGRSTLTIWVLLLGWLWMQPALAQHPRRQVLGQYALADQRRPHDQRGMAEAPRVDGLGGLRIGALLPGCEGGQQAHASACR